MICCLKILLLNYCNFIWVHLAPTKDTAPTSLASDSFSPWIAWKIETAKEDFFTIFKKSALVSWSPPAAGFHRHAATDSSHPWEWDFPYIVFKILKHCEELVFPSTCYRATTHSQSPKPHRPGDNTSSKIGSSSSATQLSKFTQEATTNQYF